MKRIIGFTYILKIKVIICLLSLLSVAIDLDAQMNSYFFYGFGKQPPWGKGKVDFTSGIPINSINNSGKLNFAEANCVMSDSSGQLLFSSNGLYIVDRIDSSMNGTDSINLHY